MRSIPKPAPAASAESSRAAAVPPLGVGAKAAGPRTCSREAGPPRARHARPRSTSYGLLGPGAISLPQRRANFLGLTLCSTKLSLSCTHQISTTNTSANAVHRSRFRARAPPDGGWPVSQGSLP